MFNLGIKILFSLTFSYIQLSTSLYSEVTSFSEMELKKIIELQNRVLEQGKKWSESELTRQAQEIVTRYENFLLDNPNDINALLLFGKFLRKTGLYESAVSIFLKADQINPGLAVVKQELGNFLVETGKPLEAFPFFLLTTRLASEEPTYHYNLGNFIFLFHDNLLEIEASEKLGALMHQSFKEAATLDPANFDYHLRFAQSFFDFNNELHEEAIAAWDTLLSEFGERSKLEIDYIKINKAKIFLKVGKQQEALHILKSVHSDKMIKERTELLKEAKTEKGSMLYKNFDENKYLFPLDLNLRRIKLITSRLRQEIMLKELRHDIAQARILSDGSISLELSYKQRGLNNL